MTTARLTAHVLLRHNIPWLLVLTAATAAVLGVIGTAIAVIGTLGNSVWDTATWFLPWLAFGAGIMINSAFPLLVAHGLSRRGTATGGGLTVAGLSIGFALLMQVGFLLEGAVYRAAGLAHDMSQPHLFHSYHQVHLVLAEYTLLFAAYLLSGWLIGLGYYRFGAWRGSFAIPVGALPLIGVFTAQSAGWVSSTSETDPPWVGSLDVATALVLSLASILVGLALLYTLTRTLPISGKVT